LTAYFALTGVVAFGDDSAARVLVRQLTETLPSISTARADLPPVLAALIDRCMAKDATDRFVDAGALIDALEAVHSAAPDVPVAIRLFAQEAETLGMVIGYLALFALLLLTWSALDVGLLDRLVPVTVIMAVAAGRVMQTRAEASRLLAQGFTGDVVRSGFAQTMEEREERRAQLRRDASIAKRRRNTVFAGLFQLIAGVVLVYVAWNTREVLPAGNRIPVYGVVMLYSGLGCLGFALVLLMRSPLRMSVWERVFRFVWLGAIGAWFLRSAAGSGTRPVKNSLALSSTKPQPIATRIESLEARVARLEQQRGRES
jgi:hypothetical protein